MQNAPSLLRRAILCKVDIPDMQRAVGRLFSAIIRHAAAERDELLIVEHAVDDGRVPVGIGIIQLPLNACGRSWNKRFGCVVIDKPHYLRALS